MAERALVLSGGSILGAFQAGALSHVLGNGFVPQAIYGTSVGSLNGAFITDRAGKSGSSVDWQRIADELVRFWHVRINRFSRIGRRRRVAELGWSLLTCRFNGILSMSRLYRLVKSEFSKADIKQAPVEFYPCAVNVRTGRAIYADKNDDRIIDYVIASTAIPIMMPMKEIGGDLYWDGGLREVAPLKQALKDGATQVVCIACDPVCPDTVSTSFFKGKLLKQIQRLMEMVVSETLENDLGTVEDTNLYLDACTKAVESLSSRRRVDLTVIQPEKTLQVDLLKFTSKDIDGLINDGITAAKEKWPPRTGGA
jgi:NTE family protein